MAGSGYLTFLRDWIPGFARLERLPRQLLGISPFDGTIRPTCVPILSPGSGRPTLPFPHPWNYAQPIMAKHHAFAEKGGRFIVPLPLLQVA